MEVKTFRCGEIMKISKLLAAISAVATFAGASQVTAQEMQPGIFMVAKGKSQKIDRHGVCRTVKNTSGNPIMVPVGTPQQWRDGKGAFLNNIGSMPGVSVADCFFSGSYTYAAQKVSEYQGSTGKFYYTWTTISGTFPNGALPSGGLLDYIPSPLCERTPSTPPSPAPHAEVSIGTSAQDAFEAGKESIQMDSENCWMAVSSGMTNETTGTGHERIRRYTYYYYIG